LNQENWITSSEPCYTDSITDRPNIAKININVSKLDTVQDHEYNFEHVLRAMFNVMAFDSSLFSTWIKSGNLKYAANELTTKIGSKKKTVLITPRVKAYVNAHVGCTTGSVEGALLEADEDNSARFTRFDRNVFANDIMAGGVQQSPVVTKLTWSM